MGMPGTRISKGALSRKIDDALNDPTDNYAKRKSVLAALQDWEGQQSLPNILVDQGILTHNEARPLREYWYNLDGWWPDRQPIEYVMRQGLIQAIDLAMHDPDDPVRGERHLPIDSYWICSGDYFEMIVILSDQQVTRLILTPSVPINLPIRSVGDPERIWSIRPGNPAEDLQHPPLVVRAPKSGIVHHVVTARHRIVE